MPTDSSRPLQLLLSGAPLSLDDLKAVAHANLQVVLDPASMVRMQASRRVVDAAAKSTDAAYGINTGFGKLSEVRVEPAQVAELQRNLVRSHCCGVGELLPEPEVRG